MTLQGASPIVIAMLRNAHTTEPPVQPWQAWLHPSDDGDDRGALLRLAAAALLTLAALGMAGSLLAAAPRQQFTPAAPGGVRKVTRGGFAATKDVSPG
jgi:hypothetical protein